MCILDNVSYAGWPCRGSGGLSGCWSFAPGCNEFWWPQNCLVYLCRPKYSRNSLLYSSFFWKYVRFVMIVRSLLRCLRSRDKCDFRTALWRLFMSEHCWPCISPSYGEPSPGTCALFPWLTEVALWAGCKYWSKWLNTVVLCLKNSYIISSEQQETF